MDASNIKVELFDGDLPVEQITNAWYDQFRLSNYGAIITFVGVVRDEDGIDGLSFDIYEPILNSWFDAWQKKANEKNAIVLMAHSRGDVLNHTSSYIAAVCSPKRRVALEMIDGLSFDIYEPILNSWFDAWQKKANEKNAIVLMAHSRGDVLNHTSSYIAAVCSPKRRVALEMIDEFVEDFKASAPIWKYDIINGSREYAEDRSTAISGAGLLN